MTLRVALNATPLLYPATGVAEYTRGLASAILSSGDVDLRLFYGFHWSSELRQDSVRGISKVKSVVLSLVPRPQDVARFVQQLCFRAIERQGIDVYHEPNVFPFSTSLPTVTTIHDLSPIRFPQTHSIKSQRKWNRLLPRALERAALILTDSEFVRREIVSLFRVPSRRVRAIHLGVDQQYRELEQSAVRQAISQYSLTPRRYVLAVGTLEPRKNLLATLRAHSELSTGTADAYPLVVAGNRGWLDDDIIRSIRRMEARGAVRFLGYVPRAHLPALYGGARMLVYPSLYEGFGLPPLEAMACGTPVVASNQGSLPEVLGGAALLVNPLDHGALRDAMRSLIEDDVSWTALQQRGLEHAGHFTWDRCARKTIEAYKSVVGALAVFEH